MSAVVSHSKTSFVWVWDIYDADKQRALRVTGEELAAAGRQRNAWTAADERVIRRIAHNGIERIAAFLNDPPRTTAIASAPDSVPVPGIRLFTLQSTAIAPTASLVAPTP